MSSAYVSGNRYLTDAEMQLNALYIFNALSLKGWTRNAIAAMLGNMQTESTINPGIWQSLDEGNLSGGFGLVQWTPATKYLDWCSEHELDPGAMSSALARIEYEVENGLQWIPTDDYPMTFEEFKTSELGADTLADAFLKNYERPAEINQPNRATQALRWYDFISGEITPTPTPKKKKKLPIWFLTTMTRRRPRRVVR